MDALKPGLVINVSLETLERMATASELELKVFAACLPPPARKLVLEYAKRRPELPLPFAGSSARVVEALTSRKTLAHVERELKKLSPRKRRKTFKRRTKRKTKGRR